MAETTKSLANRLIPQRGNKVTRHQGVVTVVGTNEVDITLDGGTTVLTGVRYLASYTPTLNDTVEVLKDGNDLFILGRLA